MSAVLRPRPDAAAAGVFAMADDDGWRRWRDRKLEERPRTAHELVVEVRDPLELSKAERGAILDRCRRSGMAIYAARATADDAAIPRRVGAQLGLRTLDADPLAGADRIARIAIDPPRAAAGFIAFSEARMLWHTDGYYHPPCRRVRAVALHCVRPAAQGGETALFDPELAWLRLREADARFVHALMDPAALTIPARRGPDGTTRPASVGPVFRVEPGAGELDVRFTARRRGVRWKHDATVAEAAARLLAILDRDAFGLRIRLDAGMGLVCNNVLHARSMIVDDPCAPRLLLRARFAERIR